MKTPFTEPATDGKTKFFWEIATKGHVQNALSIKPSNQKIDDIPYMVRKCGWYTGVVVYGTESDLAIVSDYLHKFGETHFKIIGTDFMKDYVLTSLINDSEWFNAFFKKEIEIFNDQLTLFDYTSTYHKSDIVAIKEGERLQFHQFKPRMKGQQTVTGLHPREWPKSIF